MDRENGKGLEADIESVGESGSEIELNVKGKGTNNVQVGSGNKNGDFSSHSGTSGITVRTDVDLRIEEVRAEIERETLKVQQRGR